MSDRAPAPELLDGLGGLVERLDHISIAVWDLGQALPTAGLLGGRFHDGGLDARGEFRWIQFLVPGGKLEMIAPVERQGDGFLVRYLRSRGEGLHHVTVKVADLRAAVARAEELGFEVVGVDLSSAAWKEAFVHPRSNHGVLVQLAEFLDAPPSGRTLEEVLGG